MQQPLPYLLKVTITSALMLLYYWFALRDKKFHYYNRFYLLCTVVISLVLPALQLNWFCVSSNSTSAIHIYKLFSSGEEENLVVGSAKRFNVQIFLIDVAVVFCFFMLLHLCMQVYKIFKLKKLYPVKKFKEFDFVNTDLQSAPFSFFKNIFWRKDIAPDGVHGKKMLRHELAHITQKHSLDKIFMQLVLCFYWMNPFFWWLKKELYLIHEFIADESAVENNDASAFAEMLLGAHYSQFEFTPAQSFFYSPIKRRLIMLTTSKKPQFSYLRRIMVLPLVAFVMCLFAFTIQSRHTHLPIQKSMVAKPFVLVVDAGHGGKDFGAYGNGLYEKNLNLKIADAIKKFSPEYGIDVILTRDNDVFMSPPQKVDFVNAQNADAFVSIHVNSQPKNNLLDSGFEVCLSKHNDPMLNNSQVLGSAIIQNLQKDFLVKPELLQRQVGIWILDQCKIPSALIECGYITNKNDAAALQSDQQVELMARNILQGVAMYANKKIDKDKLYQIKRSDTNALMPSDNNNLGDSVLYVLNEKIISKTQLDKEFLQPGNIMSVNVWKGQDAINKYGEKGKNGVVEITLKPNSKIKNISSEVLQTADTTPAKYFTKAYKEPQFPGGDKGWIAFLIKNLYTSISVKNNTPTGTYAVKLFFL